MHKQDSLAMTSGNKRKRNFKINFKSAKVNEKLGKNPGILWSGCL